MFMAEIACGGAPGCYSLRRKGLLVRTSGEKAVLGEYGDGVEEKAACYDGEEMC